MAANMLTAKPWAASRRTRPRLPPRALRSHVPAIDPCCLYVRPLLPRSIEASRRASDVTLDRLPTGARAHGYFDLVALILLVDMFGNSSGTTDANTSTE